MFNEFEMKILSFLTYKIKNMLSERGIECNAESKKLLEQFDHPFDFADDVTIDCSSDAEAYIQKIESKLTNREDWSVRAEGLKLAISCLKAEIFNYYSTDYSFIASDVAASVTDYRSALVRAGTLLIASSAQIFKEKYLTSIKIIIPALFKQLNHGTAIIANSCQCALMSVARYVQHPNTLNTIISKSQSKSGQHRAAVAKSLYIILQTWNTSLILASKNSIETTLLKFKNDPSQNVRATAKSALALLQGENVPGSNENMNNVNNSPYSKQNQLKSPKRNIVSKKFPNSTIPLKNSKKSSKLASPITPTKKSQTNSDFSESNITPIKEIQTPECHQSISMVSPVSPVSPCLKNSGKKKDPGSINSVKFDADESSSRNIRTPKKESPMSRKQPKIQKSPQRSPKSPKQVFSTRSQIQNENENEEKELNTTKSTPQSFKKTRSINTKDKKKLFKYQKENGIESYMPPKSMDSAESFQTLLIEIVESESYEKLEGIENLICPSLVYAANFIPQIEEWDSLIIPLLEKFKDEFKEDIIDLIIAFRCDEWLVLTSIEFYGIQFLIDSFSSVRSTQLQYSFKFFVCIITQNLDFELTEKLSKFLRRLTEFNKGAEGSELILDLIGKQKASTSNDISVQTIVMKLKGRVDCSSDGKKLNKKLIENPELIPPTKEFLFDELKPLIEEGNNGQRYLVFSFIEEMTSISFAYLVHPLMNLLITDDRELFEKTKNCLINLMNDKIVFSMVFRVYNDQEDDEKEETFLSLLLAYYQSINSNKLEELLPETFDQLSPLLESDSTVTRRIVVMIFVEFKFKIPKTFSKYFKKISTKHQKIIDLYLGKRQNS